MAATEQRSHLTHGGDVAGLLRAQVSEVHRQLEDGLTDWLSALSPARPPAGSSVVGLYLHAATVEDVTVQSLLLRIAPIYERYWSGKGPAQYSTADLEPLRAYAQQVFAATDAYLASLTAVQASQTVDLARLGQGHPTVAWVMSKFVVLELARIYGELITARQHHL